MLMDPLKPIWTATIVFTFIFLYNHLSAAYILNRHRPALARCTRLNLSSAVSPPNLPTAFDRWKFLQQTLEGDISTLQVHQILYSTLNTTLNKIQVQFEATTLTTTGSSSPFTQQYQSLPILLNHSADIIQALISSSQNKDVDLKIEPLSTTTLQLLESLQPDPLEDEDAYKSCWDLVLELHGQEATKWAEKNGDLHWKVRCSVVRLLIHYDFLTHGLEDS
jgi:hypothetical protein